MTGSTKAEIEQLKAFWTRTDDAMRLAYGRNPESLPRRCVLIGTTNRADCLPNDPSGNRRWVPIKLKHGCDVEDFMMHNRNQLWAEANARIVNGEYPDLPRELFDDAAVSAEEFRNKDLLVEDFVADMEGSDYWERGTKLQEIVEHAPDEARHKMGSKRIAGVLRQRGWSIQHRSDGNYWIPPKCVNP